MVAQQELPLRWDTQPSVDETAETEPVSTMAGTACAVSVAELEERLREQGYRGETGGPGIRLHTDELAVVLPAVYTRLGYDTDELALRSELQQGNRETTVGPVLRRAYTLFTTINQLRFGLTVDEVFPAGDEADKAPIRTAVAGLKLPSRPDEHSLADVFRRALSRLPPLPLSPQPGNYVLFPDMGFPDPTVTEAVRQADEQLLHDGTFVQACARACFSRENRSWGFRSDAKTYHRIPVVINWTNGLQSVTLFDSLSTKKAVPEGQPLVQVRDCTLGTAQGLTGLSAEIRRRQHQLQLRVAEAFTYKLQQQGAVFNRGTGYVVKDRLTPTHTAYGGLAEAEVLVRSADGMLAFLPVSMNGDERAEFDRWFVWLGQVMQHFGSELRPLLSRHRKEVPAE